MDRDREAEVGGQVAADLVPRVARIVAAHHVPVFLHEEHAGPRRVQGDTMDAVAHLNLRIGDVVGMQAAVDRTPGPAAIAGAECAGRGNGNVDPAGVGWVEQDGVQAQPASARLPGRTGGMQAQPGKFEPGHAAVGGAKQRRVLDARIDGVRIGQRWLQVPDALELPRVRAAVVVLVRAGHAVIHERIAHRRPRCAAILRPMDHLSEPVARLGGVEPVRVDRGALDMIDLPAAEMGTADVPLSALAVGCQNERALARAYQNSYAAHRRFPPVGIALAQTDLTTRTIDVQVTDSQISDVFRPLVDVTPLMR